MKPSSRTKSSIRDEASYWVVHLSSDDATDDDHEQFRGWLAADPVHEATYREAETLFNEFTELKHLGQERPLVNSPALKRNRLAVVEGTRPPPAWKPDRRFATFVSAIAASFIIAVVVGWVLVSDPAPVSPQRFATALAEIRVIELPDGSVVTLGGQTVIDATFDTSERSVVLRAGQAFFEVARDATLPFTVNAGETFVLVVGTKFDVRMGPEAVGISVLEGEVRVAKASESGLAPSLDDGGDGIRVLTAGQKVFAQNSGDLMPIQPVRMDKPGAWRDGMLIYEDAKLLDLVADVNRYYSGGIEFSDKNISELRVTAAFRPDQIEQMLQTLMRAYPLEARRYGSGRIVLGPVDDQP